ncbi:MAG: hypothetical protein H0W62_00620 [Chitinophagales bacterium]|nr:hypothetical protein [Chitinophagales bacterium]
MRNTGRPPTKPAKLADGFYIEVRNIGSKEKAVKIRSVTKDAMESSIRQYEGSRKEVTVLGEYKDEEWLTK